ncbi:MAG: mRNA interferase YafO [Pseudohongiellaceae bacterium]|jgi:mRNA interferase YafO
MLVHVWTPLRESLEADELVQLKSDFEQYKTIGTLPDYFGRDVPFDHPHTLPLVLQENVQHLHITDDGQPFPIHKVQMKRTSDTHLIYCQGVFNRDCYCLLAILSPDAHDQEHNNEIMYKLAKGAEKYRMKY